MTWKGLHVMRQELEGASRDKDLFARYQLVFESDPGRLVLADILKDLGVCQDIDPRDLCANALRNYAETFLLSKVGVRNYMAALDRMLRNGDA